MVSNPVRDMPRDNTNPERHKVRPKVGQDIPTRDEVKLILNHCREGPAKMFLRISALCGTRASETRGLSRGAVHLERGEIEIFARADASGKLGSPKTGNSRRSIPIGPRLIQELREFKLLLGRPKDSDYLLASKHGNVINHANIIKDWWHRHRCRPFGQCAIAACMRCGTSTLHTASIPSQRALGCRKSWFRHAWATAPLWSRSVIVRALVSE